MSKPRGAKMPAMLIRPETSNDLDAIRHIHQEAFRHHPHSNGNEHALVDELRKAGALTLSLVAEVDGFTVGHVAFSEVGISDGTKGWFGLGPIGVLPSHQSQGVGQALIREGLKRLELQNVAGCVVLGEPEYYGSFGFAANSGLTLEGVPAEYFMALAFGTNTPQGTVSYHAAFDAVS